jgi:hypothetical protein
MARCSVPLGQGKHFFMPSMGSYPSLYPWQNILLSVGQKPFYPSPIRRSYWYGLIKKPLGALGLVAAQMALANLDPHNFAATGDMETALGSFMGF